MNGAVFPGATINQVNNTTGRINLSATKLSEPWLTGILTVATIRAQLVAAGPASLTFSLAGARRSDILFGGDTINPTVTHGSIQAATPTPTVTNTPPAWVRA